MAKLVDTRAPQFKETNKFECAVHSITILALLYILGFAIYTTADSIITEGVVKEQSKIHIVAGCSFIVIGLLFAISGTMISCRIRKFFPQFYDENKCMLNAANFGLSIPLIARGILDICRGEMPDFELYIRMNNEFYSPLFCVFADLIPICFQLSSLVFGYIRSKKNKKLRREEMAERNKKEINVFEKSNISSNSKASYYVDIT